LIAPSPTVFITKLASGLASGFRWDKNLDDTEENVIWGELPNRKLNLFKPNSIHRVHSGFEICLSLVYCGLNTFNKHDWDGHWI